MAKLVYDGTGRLLFTKEMKEEYTILVPEYAHGPLWPGAKGRSESTALKWICSRPTIARSWTTGLKYVHNDTCYPALLVIGQLIDALKHGGYDPHKVGRADLPRTAAAAAPATISTCCARRWRRRTWRTCRSFP